MREVLKKLYKGEIHPEEAYYPKTEEQRQRQRKIGDTQERLLSELNDRTKKEWIDLLNEMNYASADDMEQAYIEGMRMGAALMMELMNAKMEK